LDYIASSDLSFADAIRNLQWIQDPNQLLMEIIPSHYSEELHRMTTDYRQYLTKAIQAYEKITDDIQRTRHEVVLKHLAWDWTFSYGEKNWFDFEKLDHRFGILGGKNATGKSAFIDTTCIALFGEPSLNRQIHCSKKMGIHCIHSQRPKSAQSSAMNTRILLSVDNQLYELERQYQQSQTDAECKPLQMNLWKIEHQERTLVASGSTLVGQWVETHIGTIDDMMRTAFVGQMDNHNFFFAKPDVQKEMIDQAVNLRELQAYSNILYDALSYYTQLLKTIGTILQATETTSILSDTEIEEKRLRLDAIQQQIAILQPQKETLAECLGTFRTQRPPTEVPETFWEELLSEAPEDWRALLTAGREQRQRLLYEREKYPNFIETLDATIPYATLLEEQQTHYETHVSHAPPAHRPRSAIETELEPVQEWMTAHTAWIKDPMGLERERNILTQSLIDSQTHIDHWMKQKPHKIEEIPQRSKRSSPKFDDWEQAVANYHTVRTTWTTAQDLHRRLDASRPKANYPEWCQSWEAFQELERECEANEWTDESTLQTQLNKVKEYLQLRSTYQQHIDTLTTQCDSIKQKLSKYPNWKKNYELWKTHQVQRTTYDLTVLHAYKTRLEAEQRLKELTAAQAPWRKEWEVWNKQAQRCSKYQWGSIDQLREQLDNARSNLQQFQKNQERYASRIQERDTFMAAHPHPECAVCSTRLASIQFELDALLREMPQSENEWNKAIVYYEKALETRRFVESLRVSMETTLERYDTELQKWESVLKQTEPVPDGLSLEDVESLIHQCNQWDAEKNKESTYVWLSELEQELQDLQKQCRRQTKKLASMTSESSLKETEDYWTNALDSFRRVQSQRAFMNAESAAWASAKAAWEALANHGDISLNVLADAWYQADAAWNAAGNRLRDQHHQMENQQYEMEHFQERWQEKHAWMERLQRELIDAETYDRWNTERQSMEHRIQYLKQCVLEMNLKEMEDECANLEPYEIAERWNAWYKYTAIQEQLVQLDEERQTLRVELAVAGVSGNPGETTPPANARRTYLMQRQDQWMTIRDHLAKLNTYMVGERGRSKKDNETSTFKEWAYKTEILPALESDINQFLTDIEVDIQFKIEYHKRALKFLVHDRGNTTTYAASSGFQQFVIGLGMRQALINLGGGTRNLKHLFIDEGFTSCDVENLEKTKDILNTLVQMGEYRSILLVSHLDAVQDIADQRIPLERHGVFSKLTYGNPYPVASGSAKRRGRPPKAQLQCK
jgi:DNA repair exonuclease SbcCD ATPase subunit